MGKKKEEKQPEPAPEPVKVPSRGALLNKWAARQDRLQKLARDIAKTKDELAEVAQLLYEHYGVVVQDSTHTTQYRTPTAAPAGEPEPETEPLKPEENPLAKSPVPIISEPTTQAMTEHDVAKIRRDSELEKGADPGQFGQDIAQQMDRAVRIGLGKPGPGQIGPGGTQPAKP